MKESVKKVFLLSVLLALPSVALASGGFEESDFVVRLINFVLFFAILFYLAFGKIKAIFINRKNNIINQLQEAQNKLKAVSKDKENAQKRLKESAIKAKEIVENAKREGEHIAQKIQEQTNAQIQSMINTMESNMEFEQIRAKRECVEEILSDVMYSKDIKFDNKDYVNIITKRIA